jgi:hypothetical protein
VPTHETFKTESLNLTAALITMGFEHTGSERHGGGRKAIVFSVEISAERSMEAKDIIRAITRQETGVQGDLVLYERHRNALKNTVKHMNGGTDDANRRRT